MTTAIVLAAGRGTRLLPHTETVPKCLIEVGGRSLLERHVTALDATADCSEIVVVAGYLADEVEKELARMAPLRVPVRVLYNPFFAVTNALFSLWLALLREPEAFVVLNADTMTQRETVRQVFEALGEHDGVLAVDRRGPRHSDAIRVCHADGRVTEVGKHVDSEAATAESVGVAGFAREGARHACRVIDRLLREPTGTSDHWHALVDATCGDLVVRSLDCTGAAWLEIDTADDLRFAQNLADLMPGRP